MYLTLPIPNRKIWSGEIVFVPYDTSKAPVKVELALPQDSTFTRVKSKLGELFGVDPERVSGQAHAHAHKMVLTHFLLNSSLEEKFGTAIFTSGIMIGRP